MFKDQTLIQSLPFTAVFASILLYSVLPNTRSFNKKTENEFLLANQSITSKIFSKIFAISGLSLAGNIIFFIEFKVQYGWLICLGPLVYEITQLCIILICKKTNFDLKNIRSIASLFYEVYPCKAVSRCIIMASFIANIMAAFGEILAGTVMISFILPKIQYIEAIIFFTLSVVIFANIKRNGYQALSVAAPLQLIFISIGTLSLFYFSCMSHNVNHLTSKEMVVSAFQYSAEGWVLALFIIWAFLTNIFGALTDISLWQRIAASTPKRALQGFKQGFKSWVIVFIIPMISLLVIHIKGHQYNSIESFLSLTTSKTDQVSYLIYMGLLLGFSAAFYSTSARKFMAAINILFDERLSQKNDAGLSLSSKINLACIVSFLSLCFVYLISSGKVSSWILPLMYAAWGQVAIIAPLVIFSLTCKYKNKTNILPPSTSQKSIILVSIIMGWATIFIGSISKNHFVSQSSFLVASIITSLGLYLSIVSRKNLASNRVYTVVRQT